MKTVLPAVLCAAGFALAGSAAPAAAAIAIDGQLDAEYPVPLVIQSLQTGLVSGGQIPGDSNLGDLVFANGSELDAMHATVVGSDLHLFLAGNLALRLNQNQNGTNGHVLDVFVDAQPGGQVVLNGLGAGHPLNGMTFDAAFEPETWFEFHGDGDQFGIAWFAGHGTLSNGGGASFTNLGFTSAGGPGTLSGGTNPLGIEVTIDNRNVAGVGFGCNAASGEGVTRGIEWKIPLAAIGSPDGCFKLMALVRDRSSISPVSNQVLSPLPPGTCPPGPASTVNFQAYAGDQFDIFCPTPTGVTPLPPAGALRLALAGANPVRGDALRFDYALDGSGPATLALFDVAGRLVDSAELAGPSGTAHLAPLPAGLYWARLWQAGAASVVERVCVMR